MKKVLSVILILSLLVSMLSGCQKRPTEYEVQLQKQLYGILDELVTQLPDSTDVEAQKKYLIKWAAAHGFPVSHDDSDNIIMSSKATEGMEDADRTIFHCSLGLGDPATSYQSIATALYLLENTEIHGPLRVIFTNNKDNLMSGASNISSYYLKASNLISLDYGEKTAFTIGSAGSKEYAFNKPLSWNAPTCTNGYKITISGLKGGYTGESGTYPNPIKVIGDFLASAKSKGVMIELASFTGGTAPNMYPSQASAVVIINDNDVSRFEKWFDNEVSKFDDKYSDFEENYVFTLENVPLPEKVISKDDSTGVFSLLYTMMNGIYLKENKKIIASSNIGTIDTQTGDLIMTIETRSLQGIVQDEMYANISIVCGLNDIEYTLADSKPIWESDEDSPLLNTLTNLFKTDFDKEISYKTVVSQEECAVFKQRNPDLDLLLMTVNFENNVTEIEALENFISKEKTPY